MWFPTAYAQADLRLCWSHIPHFWKFHVVAHLMSVNDKCNDLHAPSTSLGGKLF